MRSILYSAPIVVAVLALASCSRDPNVAKVRYLESGNKYFEKGRFKEAYIQYRNAIKLDPRYGAAHYRLALTDLKLAQPDVVGALREFRRAAELIKEQPEYKGRPEYWDTIVKLSDLYLFQIKSPSEPLLQDVQKYCDELLQHDANSFDGHRLTGDLRLARAMAALQAKSTEEAKKLFDEAFEQFRLAESAKPGEAGIAIRMAHVKLGQSDIAGAEQFYWQAISRDKTNLASYDELLRVLRAENKQKEAEDLLKAGYRDNPKKYEFLTSLAGLYLSQNRRDDMLSVLQQLKSKAGEYPKAYLAVGDFYLRVGDGDAAIREYREGMSKDVKNKANYQKHVLEVLMRQGKRAEADDINAQILKDNPHDADALGVSATLLLEKGDVAKALTELQQVATRAPGNPVAHYNLGRAYFLHGDTEQARQEFTKAVELKADYILPRLSLAQLQVARGEYDVALKTAQDILKYDPNNNSAKLIQTAALVGQKKFSESRQQLQTMLKGNPNSPDTVFQLGVVNLAENNYKEAEEAFRRAYQLNPANSRGLMGVVETYMAQGKPDQAIQVLQAESAKMPDRLDFHVAMGNVAVRSGRWDAAVAEFQKVLAGSPKDSKAQGEMYLRIGETLRQKGDLAGAVSALQSARQSLPGDPRVLSSLAVALNQSDHWDEARLFYEATLKIQPSNGFALNNLAYGLAEHNGDLNQAITLAQRARQLLPNLAEVTDTLGWIYLKKNLADDALGLFQEIVTKNPNQPTYRYHLGMAFSQKGDKVRAKEELKKALDANPSKTERQQIQDLLSRL